MSCSNRKSLAKARKYVINSLKTKLSEDQAIFYERKIWNMVQKMCDDDPDVLTYTNVAMEKVCHLLTSKTKEERKEICRDINRGIMGWNSTPYNDLRDKQSLKLEDAISKMELEPSKFPCKNRNCRSTLTYYYQSQDRSGDEGFTTHVICSRCGHKYSFN
jgi:DNA-directed RNA polymerase subunit M/transcription elongation factor TFIIS